MAKPTVADDGLGPAFDTGTLSTPTSRKLVGCWMEQAGEGLAALNERTLTLESGGLDHACRAHLERINRIHLRLVIHAIQPEAE